MSTGKPQISLAIERLLHNDAFPHDVIELTLLETHISWVILTGPFAYKIKKPVKFDFVDYSTLDLRHMYCEKELALNRRFAPDLYLEVVPIFEDDGKVKVGKTVESKSDDRKTLPIEYAVKMNQFSQASIVASRLHGPELTARNIDEFADKLAKFHASIDIATPDRECVQIEKIGLDSRGNFDTLRNVFKTDPRATTLAILEMWTLNQFERLIPVFDHRLQSGRVRQCHGDMHLKNIVQIDGQLTPFDGIEFNEEFQWIDVLSEIAFSVMDFMARGRVDLGWRLLNLYLESTGDYENLNVLRFYLVYRAMVRAKVTWLNPGNRSAFFGQHGGADEYSGPWDKYLSTAMVFASGLTPRLSITFGFSGSGKSTIAMREIERHGGVRIRSDVVRNQMDRQLTFRNKYSSDTTQRIYDYLYFLAKEAIVAGFPVIIDATFLKSGYRERFIDLAKDLKVEFQILNCSAPFEVLKQRILNRGPDASEATIEVLKHQMEDYDPLTATELKFTKYNEGD